MEYFKNSPDQHIGSLELNRYRMLLKRKYEAILRNCILSYGVLDNSGADPAFDNLKVVNGTVSTKHTLKAGYALDKNFNLIHVPEDIIDAFDVSNSTGVLNAVIEFVVPDNFKDEEGTISIDKNGVMTGVGTKFTECIKGEPYHPSRIKFTNSKLNPTEFRVASVSSDTSATLSNDGGFKEESGLTYKVVGTFTPGIVVPKSSKDIYEFEGKNYKLSIISTAFPLSVLRPGEQFTLANLGIGFSVDQRSLNLLTII